MKYLTVYCTSSRLLYVKSQQGVHDLRTSEQAPGGRRGGEWLGVGKEIWRNLICAHLKFEFHPQGPRLLLWWGAISEYNQSYLTYNPRSNVKLINNYSPYLPHPIWIPLEKIAVGKQGVDHLTFRKRKQVPPFIGFRQNLFYQKKQKTKTPKQHVYVYTTWIHENVLWLS